MNKEDLVFSNLFNQTTSKTILLNEFDKILINYPSTLICKDLHEDLFVELLGNNSGHSLSQLLSIMGAKLLIKEVGIRRFREISGKFGSNSWYRLNKKLAETSISLNKHDTLYELRGKLNDFKTIILNELK